MLEYQNLCWTSRSAISSFTAIDLTFQLSPGFFTDPDTPKQATTIALPMLPGVSRSSGEYTSREALNNLDDLVQHYRTVLDLSRRHDLYYTDYFYHFWLRLRLRAEDSEIEFAGYDSWRQMRAVFTWIRHALDGAEWRDTCDRWDLRIARVGDRIHFRETGVDRSARQINVAFPKTSLLAEISPLIERVETIISRLVDAIGDDYWTDYRRDLA